MAKIKTMLLRRPQKIFWIGSALLIFFILDRIFKSLALLGKIAYQKNFGIAFSLNLPANLFIYFYLLVFLILIAIVWSFITACQKKNWWSVAGFYLIILGAASNLIDRIKFGYIIDYFNFGFFYNNLADILICVGLIIVIFSWRTKKSENL